MHVFDLQELEAATDDFSPSKLIGKGSHGSVYRGLLKDGNLVVAIKKQSLALQKLQDNTKLENEASILSSIPPNLACLINLLGVSHDTYGNKLIVTRHMPNGTLHEALHTSTTPPSWQKRLEIALQIAKGVRFLHESSPTIVHRDIKPANILFDKTWNATLADFGLAARLNNEEVETKLPAGTIGYIDPSYTTPSKLSTKIDVFSYGVVFLELISGRKAMDVSKSPPSIVEWAVPLIKQGRAMEVCDERVRLPRDMARTVKQMLRVAARCLSTSESARPTMSEIVVSFEKLSIGPIGPVQQLESKSFSIRDTIVKMMRLRKNRGCGHNTNSNSISKGALLVREILADVTLN
ncbi:hypothetical protein CASFOL_019800 [Castilleja foliolosa]|uniref:non-specific serine/threonine protein kinase n=1 Tax=Castilleja foliolosa TaxID=1961234 RepID=A0ABD3CZV3_9LAMI